MNLYMTYYVICLEKKSFLKNLKVFAISAFVLK